VRACVRLVNADERDDIEQQRLCWSVSLDLPYPTPIVMLFEKKGIARTQSPLTEIIRPSYPHLG